MLSENLAPDAAPAPQPPARLPATPAPPPKSAPASVLTPLELRAVDAFVNEPTWLATLTAWPQDRLGLGDCAGRRFARERLAERRFAGQQLKQHAYRPDGAKGPLEIRFADLCPDRADRRGHGVIPPGVRVAGYVDDVMLSPYAPYPDRLHVLGTMRINGDHNPEARPVELPRDLLVEKDFFATCRSYGTSFVAPASIKIMGDSFIGRTIADDEIYMPDKQSWGFVGMHAIEVGKNLFVTNTAIHLPPTVKIGGTLDCTNVRMQNYFPSALVGNLVLNRVSGLTHLSTPQTDIFMKDIAVIRNCPDLRYVGHTLRPNTHLCLFGNTSLHELPRGMRASGDLRIFGNGIKTLPDDMHIGGDLLVAFEPCTTLGKNLTVNKNILLYHMPKLINFPDNLRIGGNFEVIECPYLQELPKDLEDWGPAKDELDRPRITAERLRVIAISRTALTPDLTAALKPEYSVIRHDIDDAKLDAVLEEFRRKFTTGCALSDALPAQITPSQRENLHCSITLDSVAELQAKGTAAVLGSGEQVRLFDYPSFMEYWFRTGQDPATRQFVTPYDLKRLVG